MVPTIDIGPFLAGGSADRARAVDALARAAGEIGFFAIDGHGVARATVDRLYASSRAFFEQPQEVKQRAAPPQPQYSRGYKAVGFEALAFGNATATPTDLKEFYHFGRSSWPEDDPYYSSEEGKRYFLRNIWPDSPPGFSDAADAYYRGMETLAADLCRMSALALGLDEHFFADKIDRHITAARINYYPPQPNPPAEGQLRAGSHTDFGMLTILSGEDAPGGLQVQARAGEWIDVATDRYRFVCNIGDLLMRWTNDRWVSNWHRVLNPPRAVAAATSRISIGFFHHPNYDARIECIPGCAAPGAAPKYPPVLSGEFRDEKYNATRLQNAA